MCVHPEYSEKLTNSSMYKLFLVLYFYTRVALKIMLLNDPKVSSETDCCMAESGVFIGRVLKFSSEETDLFPHYRKLFCMAASGVNGRSLNYWLRLPI